MWVPDAKPGQGGYRAAVRSLKKELEATWSDVATRRGGELRPSTGLFSYPTMSIPLRAGWAELDVSSSNRGTATRCRAPFALRISPAFSVTREHMFAKIMKAVRVLRDVEMGNRAFDSK